MIDRSSYYLTRLLPDGRVVDVTPLLFGRARIIISNDLEDYGWTDGW